MGQLGTRRFSSSEKFSKNASRLSGFRSKEHQLIMVRRFVHG